MKYEEILERAEKKVKSGALKESRFKIPEIEKFYEGNKTVFKNFKGIAKQLSRDPKHLLEFYLGKLATNGELRGNRAIFTGKFGREKLKKGLEEYVNRYVKCPECGKPDTKLIKKEGYTFIKCMACGAESPVS